MKWVTLNNSCVMTWNRITFQRLNIWTRLKDVSFKKNFIKKYKNRHAMVRAAAGPDFPVSRLCFFLSSVFFLMLFVCLQVYQWCTSKTLQEVFFREGDQFPRKYCHCPYLLCRLSLKRLLKIEFDKFSVILPKPHAFFPNLFFWSVCKSSDVIFHVYSALVAVMIILFLASKTYSFPVKTHKHWL